MNNTDVQILQNFRGLFGRYKAIVTENEKQTKITVGDTTVAVNKVRSTPTQNNYVRF